MHTKSNKLIIGSNKIQKLCLLLILPMTLYALVTMYYWVGLNVCKSDCIIKEKDRLIELIDQFNLNTTILHMTDIDFLTQSYDQWNKFKVTNKDIKLLTDAADGIICMPNCDITKYDYFKTFIRFESILIIALIFLCVGMCLTRELYKKYSVKHS